MIDPITLFLASLSNPLLTKFAVLLDKLLYPLVFVLVVFMLWRFKEKRRQILIAMILVCILTVGLKLAVPIERPCVSGLESKIACPIEASFPSGHASVAFGLAFASIGTFADCLFWPLALITAFTRVYLGFHTILDVVGSFILGLACYLIALWIEKRLQKGEKK